MKLVFYCHEIVNQTDMMISLNLYYLIAALLLPGPRINGPELLEKSIAFHDPTAAWHKIQVQFSFEETRPVAEPRYTTIAIDNLNGNFCLTRIVDGTHVDRHVVDGKCSYQIEKNSEISAAEMADFRLTDERTLFMRNYYLYLWGLPMKLKDAGTIVHETVEEVQFNNRNALKMKVTYEAETGSDTWYFYLDPETFSLIGYQFYHDEEAGDGEYILLGKSAKVLGMNIPNQRAWYTNKDSTLLGTDTFTSTALLTAHH